MGRVYYDKDFYEKDIKRKESRTGSVIVIGPEASGTKWISKTIKNHEDVHCVHHLSFPSGEDRHWPDLWKFDKLGLSSIIIVCRDETITKLSQERMGYTKQPEKYIDTAKTYIKQQLSTWKGKVALISYESMLQWPTIELSQTFRLLDYDENKFDYNTIKPIDGNKKYVRMEE